MIEFKLESTTFKVASIESRAKIEATAKKITRRTGRTSTKGEIRPVYPRFIEGTSTAFYVREYETLNNARFAYARSAVNSIFGELSCTPQFSQDGSHIEEFNE
jgi:hypothetical protein